jgi:hypothetical protein
VKIQSTIRNNPRLNQLKTAGIKTMDKVGTASDTVERNPVLGAALATAGSGVRTLHAFPRFVYPTVYGAQGAEKAQILETMDRLPLHQVADVRSIRMVDQLSASKPGWVVHGRANDLDVTNRIRLSRNSLSNPEKFQATLVHEVGHTVDYETQHFRLWGERSTQKPFGEGPHISEYAKTNHREDFAESYEEFHLNPENLKDKAPEKYEAVEDLNKPGFMEKLIDREEFRETGKYMSEVFGKSETSRHVASGALMASSMLQGVHGVSQWVRSASTGDSLGHASGILNTAAAAAFVSGASPLLGMALHGASQSLHGAVRRGDLSAEEVESAVALTARPVEALFGRDPVRIEDHHRPGKVAAVAAGGAIGGAAGSMIGPYLGVIGGYHLAGGLGGVIGLVGGGMLGFMGGAALGGRIAGAIARVKDKPQNPDYLTPVAKSVTSPLQPWAKNSLN